jgi:RNA polymerase sigma-70 factor (ECF subfamily)
VLDALTREDGDAAASPAEAPDEVLDRVLLVDAMSRLPHGQREVLCMAFYQDLTQARIAERTGLPLGTVKSHARRGLHRLRAVIEEGRACEVPPEWPE